MPAPPASAPASPSATIIAGLREALAVHAPFGAMTERDLDRIVRAAQLRYFAPDAVILAPGTSAPTHCHIVKQGRVRGEKAGAAGAAPALRELSAGDMFPLKALTEHRGVASLYRAVDDVFCLVIPAAVFDELIERSPVFEDFCTRHHAHLLDLSQASVQADYAAGMADGARFLTPLSELARQAPVVVAGDIPLASALATMEERRIGALPVVDARGRPLGIFTRQDVIARIVLPGRPLTAPIRDVMSQPVHTLAGESTAADAALLMAAHGVRHIVVVGAAGEVTGIVSERDLFRHQRLSVRELHSNIGRAPDVDALAACAADLRALSHALVAQGVNSAQLTRMISSLNDRLAVRLLDIEAENVDLSGLALCWVGMGSEGRSEQTIATDQDNGLIFVPTDAALTPAAARERLLPFAQRVNAALDRCGYPLCKGNVMAGNPRWCLSLAEWQNAFAHWIDRGDPESLLAANIFFDFRALWGKAALAEQLRAGIAGQAKANARFLKQMSDNALRSRPALNWWGGVDAGKDARGVEGIDLKLSGAGPMVDGARIFALASGVTATNTRERLTQAAPHIGLPADEVHAWNDAFDYLQMLRLRNQHRHSEPTADASGNPNFIALRDLSELDRRILRETLRQVRGLQQRLELDYP